MPLVKEPGCRGLRVVTVPDVSSITTIAPEEFVISVSGNKWTCHLSKGVVIGQDDDSGVFELEVTSDNPPPTGYIAILPSNGSPVDTITGPDGVYAFRARRGGSAELFFREDDDWITQGIFFLNLSSRVNLTESLIGKEFPNCSVLIDAHTGESITVIDQLLNGPLPLTPYDPDTATIESQVITTNGLNEIDLLSFNGESPSEANHGISGVVDPSEGWIDSLEPAWSIGFTRTPRGIYSPSGEMGEGGSAFIVHISGGERDDIIYAGDNSIPYKEDGFTLVINRSGDCFVSIGINPETIKMDRVRDFSELVTSPTNAQDTIGGSHVLRIAGVKVDGNLELYIYEDTTICYLYTGVIPWTKPDNIITHLHSQTGQSSPATEKLSDFTINLHTTKSLSRESYLGSDDVYIDDCAMDDYALYSANTTANIVKQLLTTCTGDVMYVSLYVYNSDIDSHPLHVYLSSSLVTDEEERIVTGKNIEPGQSWRRSALRLIKGQSLYVRGEGDLDLRIETQASQGT